MTAVFGYPQTARFNVNVDTSFERFARHFRRLETLFKNILGRFETSLSYFQSPKMRGKHFALSSVALLAVCLLGTILSHSCD